MPGVPEHSGHHHQRHMRNITDSEEEGPKDKSRKYRHGFIGKGKQKSREDDAEIMTAIWGGADRKQLGAINIQMCMDDAGRWRIAWGQLVD